MTEEQKKKWLPVLVPELMCSEDSEDEDDVPTLTTRPLLWRSDKVSNFIARLDQKSKSMTTQRSKRMMMKRRVGLPSDRLPDRSLPEWMVKKSA